MRRLNILAKGNADVRDSLHALIEDGAVRWNGLNVALQNRGSNCRALVIHETMARSDALLMLPAPVPETLAARGLPLGPHDVEAQFVTRLFDGDADAVVLSIQPDVMNRLARHKADGHVFYPHEAKHWPEDDRRWLGAHYEALPPLESEQAMANLAALATRIRAARDVPVLVFNLSPVLPWERVHSFTGLDETLGERIRRFNLALIGLSRREGIAIVDVEAVVARGGLDTMKRDAVALTPTGAEAVATEVVRVLDDLGVLP